MPAIVKIFIGAGGTARSVKTPESGMYGGASFVLIYLVFLAILGLPIMVAEFAVGRASVRSAWWSSSPSRKIVRQSSRISYSIGISFLWFR